MLQMSVGKPHPSSRKSREENSLCLDDFWTVAVEN
jgi:hypothetical protein